ncbi:hypothetical protein BH09BAC2_BH09BAC2_08490 [soil metagenome]
MKSKNLLFLLVLFLLATPKAEAQYYFYNEDYYDDPILFEIGASVGAINSLTDIGGHSGIGKKFLKDLNFGNTQFNASLFFALQYQSKLGLRLEATIGQLKGYDSILKKDYPNTSGRYERNLSFRTKISEFTIIGEVYPTYLFRQFDTDVEPPRAAPYVMFGVGFFHFNPQTQYQGRWVDLQPLHTEGQGFIDGRPNYQLTQMNIPLGLGLRYELAPRILLRAEFLYRKLSTDYLDDVSTTYVDPSVFDKLPAADAELAKILNKRSLPGWEYSKVGDKRGNPDKDAYFTFNLKFGWILGRHRL